MSRLIIPVNQGSIEQSYIPIPDPPTISSIYPSVVYFSDYIYKGDAPIDEIGIIAASGFDTDPLSRTPFKTFPIVADEPQLCNSSYNTTEGNEYFFFYRIISGNRVIQSGTMTLIGGESI